MARRQLVAAVAAVSLGVLVGCGAPPSEQEPAPPPTAEPTQTTGGGTPSQGGTAATTPAPSATSPSASGSGTGSPGGPASRVPSDRAELDLAKHTPAVSWQQALGIAKEQFDGQLASIELGWERDGLVYDVELVSDTEEFEADVSADDGTVLSQSTDALDDDESAREKVIDTPGIVSVEDAMAAATERLPGRVVEWKLDRNSGGVYFEFDIVSGGREDSEVLVDATTGKVIRVDD